MRRWSILLGFCLALQVALAIGVNRAQTDYSTFKPMETMLSIEAQAIDEIRIEKEDQRQVELTKQKGKWRVLQLNNFPADQDKIEDFLKTLAALKKGWPVATTTAAQKRFKVAENSFERRITLSYAGRNIDTLYIGSSPSFRKVHARSKGDDAVYAVKFNDYEAGAKPEDWIDKGILKHQASEIKSVQIADFILSRLGENLVVEGIDKRTEETVAEEAERLVKKIANLRIRNVLGTTVKPDYNQDRPILSYTIVLSSGDSEKYVFSKPQDADYYVLKPSHREEYFKVDAWSVDEIKKIGRSKLVREKGSAKEVTKDNDGSKIIESSKTS